MRIARPCRRAQLHTPCPTSTEEWRAWAAAMQRTHEQLRCPGCGKWVVWLPAGQDLDRTRTGEHLR